MVLPANSGVSSGYYPVDSSIATKGIFKHYRRYLTKKSETERS